MLGDLLANLTDEASASAALARLGQGDLLTAARARAAAEGLDLANFVTQAVRRYANAASDEEWITLMGLLNRAPDPGATCLQRALLSALQS